MRHPTALRPITGAAPPFTGVFKPEESLSKFDNRDAIVQADWTLQVQDHANQDGGTLHAWTLEITTKATTPRRDTSFNIDVRFDGGLTPSQRSVFQVNFDAADAFDIPTPVALTALHAAPHHVCRTTAPKPEILPE